MPPSPIQALLRPEALHGIGVVREPVPDAHRLPQTVILEQLVPVPADTCGASERARIVDEAEDVQRDLGRERAEEVPLQKRGDRRGQEEQLRGRAFLDECVEVLPPRGGGEHGETGDMGDDGGVGLPEGRLAGRRRRSGRRGRDDRHVECVGRRLGWWRGHGRRAGKQERISYMQGLRADTGGSRVLYSPQAAGLLRRVGTAIE
ncbi:hypothetical protein GSI_01275 [Ganoderma sinense ZZ0214-1]|uniref:Uncharacterized protein n=1 Tax=Ganoderma sinense ZZ0214-1 TaxID=1077348 RepID=A0A2G8SUX3_9APHY|nr:hypothetical protein GSI_01275 [Ganoderma sinense ZZ0214-1]